MSINLMKVSDFNDFIREATYEELDAQREFIREELAIQERAGVHTHTTDVLCERLETLDHALAYC